MLNEPHPSNEAPRGEGGEWQLLLARLSSWLNTVEPEQLWDQSQRPLQIAAALLSLLIVLKLYGAVLETIDSVPLISGLLELVGLIWLLRFSSGHLLRREDRDQTVAVFAERLRRFLQRG